MSFSPPNIKKSFYRFGHSGFLIFWMVNFVGMLSVGLALEAMVTLMTTRFIPFFLIFWIICTFIGTPPEIWALADSESQRTCLWRSCLFKSFLMSTATVTRCLSTTYLELFGQSYLERETNVSKCYFSSKLWAPSLTAVMLVPLHFGILISWTALSAINIPLFQWYRRRILHKANED